MIMPDTPPSAIAQVRGDMSFPRINGEVRFYQLDRGVLVQAEIDGLPVDPQPCAPNVYAMHIHESGNCTGTAVDPFANVGGHFNPTNCPHSAHAGDLPSLLGNDGFAWSETYTERFAVEDVLGRALVIHAGADDQMTQPMGLAGRKIGCGVIRRF